MAMTASVWLVSGYCPRCFDNSHWLMPWNCQFLELSTFAGSRQVELPLSLSIAVIGQISMKYLYRQYINWTTSVTLKVKAVFSVQYQNTRWFKYDRDWFVQTYAQISPGHIWTTLYLSVQYVEIWNMTINWRCGYHCVLQRQQDGACDIGAPFCAPGHTHMWGPCCCNYCCTQLLVTCLASACGGGSRSVQRRSCCLQLSNSWSSAPDPTLLSW